MESRDLKHLELAARHVTQAERRIANQRQRIAELERGGHDPDHAKDLLRLFEETHRLMVIHRDMILRHLNKTSSGGH